MARRTATEIIEASRSFYKKLGKTLDDGIENLEDMGVPPELACKIVGKVFESAILQMTDGLRKQDKPHPIGGERMVMWKEDESAQVVKPRK